jgi:hypothetical protein
VECAPVRRHCSTLDGVSGVLVGRLCLSRQSRRRVSRVGLETRRSLLGCLTGVLTTMDEETFLDDEIYDDDGEYHPVDDVMHGVDARPALLPSANDDDDDDADLDIANLGTHFTSLDIAPASCFTPAHLSSLAGCELHNLHAHTFIEMRADAVEEDLSSVGRLMPGLAEARMNASIVPTMRAFGSTFQQMKVLWLSRSELRDLSGIASLVSLTEAYLSFNDVTDVSPLSELDFLTTLDLEGNRVADSDAPEYLNMCPCLTELSLEGNPLARTMGYRNKVCCAVKRLLVLDDRPVTESDRVAVTESESGDSESDGETETTATKTDAARARQPETIDEPAEYEKSPAKKPKRNAEGNNSRPSLKKAAAAAAAAARYQELDIVTEGIKYAAVGIDDPDAVTARNETTGELSVTLVEDMLGGLLVGDDDDGDVKTGTDTGRPPTRKPHVSRPGTARSLTRANSLGASVRGTLASGSGGGNASRPGTARIDGHKSSSNSISRPGTAAASSLQSWGSFGSVSGAASSAGGSQNGSRPSTAMSWSATRSASRPGTAASFGDRPGSRELSGTGASWGSGGGGQSRPGTTAREFETETRLDSLFWRKNKQKETSAGLVERGDHFQKNSDSDDDGTGAASALTMGAGIVVGNPASVLLRRKRGVDDNQKSNQANDATDDAREEDILTQLRRWKIEMAETFSRFDASGNERNDVEGGLEAFRDFSVSRESETEINKDAKRELGVARFPSNQKPTETKFTPQPPAAPKSAVPKFAPQPPGAPNGPRRPPGRAVSAGSQVQGVTSVVSKYTGPTSGVALRLQNPTPNPARARPPTVDRSVVDRLVLE